jgi:hypothetical protein
MENSIPFLLSKSEAAQLSQIIEDCLKSIAEANERMEHYEADTLKSQAETKTMLEQMGRRLNVETNC